MGLALLGAIDATGCNKEGGVDMPHLKPPDQCHKDADCDDGDPCTDDICSNGSESTPRICDHFKAFDVPGCATTTTTGSGGSGGATTTTTGSGGSGGATTTTTGSGGSGGATTTDPGCDAPAVSPSAGACIVIDGVGILCNPVTNEGCDGAAGAACDLGGNGFECYPDGNVHSICETCDTNGDYCQGGLTCSDNKCLRYCCEDGDCGTGVCDKTVLGDAAVGVCRPP